MPTPRTPGAQSLGADAQPRSRRRAALLAPVLLPALLLGGALLSTGCGESNPKTTAAATASQATTAPASPPATTSTTPTTAAGSQTTTRSSPGPASPGKHRSRAHLVLPPPGSHPEPKITPSQAASLPVADISLSSAAIKQVGRSSVYTIAKQYTCGGGDISPPLHWTGIPPTTKELALFVISTTPVDEKLYFDWAIAGLDPKLTGLEAGRLPAGTVAGRNSAGATRYTLCPPNTTKPENYLFVLYALPKSLAPKPGFDPQTLRLQAKQIARHTGILAGAYG